MDPVTVLTPDAPKTLAYDAWDQWFRSLVPSDAMWYLCCVGISHEPEQHLNVSWYAAGCYWHVQQVSFWYKITAGRMLAITRSNLREVVAVLRLLGALSSDKITVGR